MKLEYLLLNLKMVMFGGKGGVGKTSSAASSAIWAAEHGRKTLIISTDPAHSLGDSLGMELEPGVPTPIPEVPHLTAMEINPKVSMSEIQGLSMSNPMEGLGMEGMGGGLMEGAGFGDLSDFTSMNPPGIDEALAFGKVLEFIETDHEYDLVVFDTAPTGHTLRFLSLPETLSSWVGKLLKMRFKIGKLFGSFKRLFSKDENKEDNSLEMLEKFNDAIINARGDLMDPTKNSFVIVMIPEEMAIAETGRLLNELVKYNIPVSNIIVNQLYQENTDLCEFCKSRRRMQQKNLEKIREIFQEKLNKNLVEVPLFREEIREYSKLKEMASYLFKNS